MIGVYLISFNTTDLHIMVLVAIVALTLRLLGFPMAPMLLGFILGKPMEDNLRRALLINDNSISFLWKRPITLTILCLTLVVVIGPILRKLFAKVAK